MTEGRTFTFVDWCPRLGVLYPATKEKGMAKS